MWPILTQIFIFFFFLFFNFCLIKFISIDSFKTCIFQAENFSSIFPIHLTILKSSLEPSFLIANKHLVSGYSGWTSTTKCFKSFNFYWPLSWYDKSSLTNFYSPSFNGTLLGFLHKMFLNKLFNLLISSYFYPPNSKAVNFLFLSWFLFSSLTLFSKSFFKLAMMVL